MRDEILALLCNTKNDSLDELKISMRAFFNFHFLLPFSNISNQLQKRSKTIALVSGLPKLVPVLPHQLEK